MFRVVEIQGTIIHGLPFRKEDVRISHLILFYDWLVLAQKNRQATKIKHILHKYDFLSLTCKVYMILPFPKYILKFEVSFTYLTIYLTYSNCTSNIWSSINYDVHEITCYKYIKNLLYLLCFSLNGHLLMSNLKWSASGVKTFFVLLYLNLSTFTIFFF